jgi:hypothetical protein
VALDVVAKTRARLAVAERRAAYCINHEHAHRTPASYGHVPDLAHVVVFQEAAIKFFLEEEDIRQLEADEVRRHEWIERSVHAAAVCMPSACSDDYSDEFPAPSAETIGAAKDLLRKLLEASSEHGANPIALPEFEPTANGGVDLHWKTDGVELLVAVPNNASKPITFYGDAPGTDVTIKGTLSNGGRIRFLAQWLLEIA